MSTLPWNKVLGSLHLNIIHRNCVSFLMDHVGINVIRREDTQNCLMIVCKVHFLQLSLPFFSCLGVKNAGPEKLLPVWEKSLASAEGLSCQQWTYSFGWLRPWPWSKRIYFFLTLHEVLCALCVLIKRLSQFSVGSKELLANLISVFLFIHFFPTINCPGEWLGLACSC